MFFFLDFLTSWIFLDLIFSHIFSISHLLLSGNHGLRKLSGTSSFWDLTYAKWPTCRTCASRKLLSFEFWSFDPREMANGWARRSFVFLKGRTFAVSCRLIFEKLQIPRVLTSIFLVAYVCRSFCEGRPSKTRCFLKFFWGQSWLSRAKWGPIFKNSVLFKF